MFHLAVNLCEMGNEVLVDKNEIINELFLQNYC